MDNIFFENLPRSKFSRLRCGRIVAASFPAQFLQGIPTMAFTRNICRRLITIPTVILLAFIFSFGFNFLKVFFPDHQSNTINSSEFVPSSSRTNITGKDYKIFPSRNQLIADPKHDLSKISASHLQPDVNPVFSFFPNRTTGFCCTNSYSRIHNQSLPTTLPSSLLSQYCIFLI